MVALDLPGIAEDKVSIEVDEGVLLVSGLREGESLRLEREPRS
jgi:HSP20 family molecular chaperone IbpA